MEKENNTALSCGNPIEVGAISCNYAVDGHRRVTNGTLFIRQIFGVFNILLRTDRSLFIVIPKKSVKWEKTYNAYAEVGAMEYFFNLPDYMIDLIGVRK